VAIANRQPTIAVKVKMPRRMHGCCKPRRQTLVQTPQSGRVGAARRGPESAGALWEGAGLAAECRAALGGSGTPACQDNGAMPLLSAARRCICLVEQQYEHQAENTVAEDLDDETREEIGGRRDVFAGPLD
jgi:hypothetical protein